ncbi:type 1 glutamine amidotransferase domain-containing protein [Qingshengfaniella alkalisoli]|uniref:Type 1 glutamine amidotransferase n=1 Tax=Qingshengfaniella alkalisoli TaxID=2599296 RepID=A0A5B8I7A3_9RHOB|nr:type 1 glutamine amidotransferase domain-containing protein [Qingshengfaniella alkalisoli]QDY69429.1 type 1 glutamine amidotransferase [Qingshengfaniella alkalisoli]
MPAINESAILMISTHGFEQSELDAPRTKLSSAGATVHLATPGGEDIRGWKNKDWGDIAHHDKRLEEVSADDYDAIVIPGGQMNPDILRTNAQAVRLVRDFVEQGKIVAAICHGPWLLIEAGVTEGREMTSYHSIKTDLVNAGANWVDEAVAVSNGIITSRSPANLDAFVTRIIEEVQEGRHKRAA